MTGKTADSFGSRATIEAGGQAYEIFRCDAVPGSQNLPYSLKMLLENLLRNEDGVNVTADHISALANWDPRGGAGHRDPVHPGPGDHAGLHRRARRRRPRRDARGHAAPRRRPEEDQPARPGRTGHRPLGDRRRLRPPGRVRAERRAGVRAQPGALPVPALGPGRLRRLPGRPAGHRHRAPGQPRIPGPRGLDGDDGERHRRYPDTLRRHRLAHHDDQRPRRPRLGRRRHRGRGRDARPAGLDADPAGRRLQASPASCPKGRPRPTWCSPSPRCCASTAWSASSSSSTATASARSRSPNRATIGNMAPEYGSTCAIFPIDDETLDYLRSHRPAGGPGRRWSRRTPRRRASGTTRPASRASPRSSSSTSPPSCRRSPGPKRPQDRVQLANAKTAFRDALPAYIERPANELSSRPPTRPDDRRRPRRADATRSTVTLEDGTRTTIDHGAVVIAAITSCTNTSNPFVMIGAGLLAKKAVETRPDAASHGSRPPSRPARRSSRTTTSRPGLTAVPRQARLQPRRLRLHDLHRQLRPAAARRSAPRSTTTTSPSCRGPVRQPQLRGPDQPRREDELPRVAAAGRRLRARRHDGHRPAHRPARHRPRRQAGLPGRHLADAATRSAVVTARGRRGDVHPRLRRCLRRRRRWHGLDGRRRATPSSGTTTRPTSGARRTSTACPPSRRRSPTSTAPGCSRCSATASPPTTSRRPARSRRPPPPGST